MGEGIFREPVNIVTSLWQGVKMYKESFSVSGEVKFGAYVQ